MNRCFLFLFSLARSGFFFLEFVRDFVVEMRGLQSISHVTTTELFIRERWNTGSYKILLPYIRKKKKKKHKTIYTTDSSQKCKITDFLVYVSLFIEMYALSRFFHMGINISRLSQYNDCSLTNDVITKFLLRKFNFTRLSSFPNNIR